MCIWEILPCNYVEDNFHNNFHAKNLTQEPEGQRKWTIYNIHRTRSFRKDITENTNVANLMDPTWYLCISELRRFEMNSFIANIPWKEWLELVPEFNETSVYKQMITYLKISIQYLTNVCSEQRSIKKYIYNHLILIQPIHEGTSSTVGFIERNIWTRLVHIVHSSSLSCISSRISTYIQVTVHDLRNHSSFEISVERYSKVVYAP